MTSYQGELEEAIEIMTANDEDENRRNAMMKAVSLPARSQILKNLARLAQDDQRGGRAGQG
ncbi:hypothetical protein QP162_12665 [Sphingomonas aurantiaca]|uniref:hypothetical protein n=1 Tax=Sphingomonas aurantiaca TaxID=185949 RepID=UPI002FE284D9